LAIRLFPRDAVEIRVRSSNWLSGIVDRSEFMIDGFRVGNESGAGCRCVCVEFATHASCKHTREAAGRLAAQGRIAEHLSQGASKAYSTRLMR
jgi:hypothetical protein